MSLKLGFPHGGLGTQGRWRARNPGRLEGSGGRDRSDSDSPQREGDRVQAAEAAAHDRHDLVGPLDAGARGPARRRGPASRGSAGCASGQSSIGCHACSCRYAWRSSTSGNAAPKRSAHIGLNATTTSPFADVAEEHVRERERDALGDQVEQVARVVVVDVGERERALAAVHGDDVLGRPRSRAARRATATATAPPTRRSRARSARGLAEHGLRRLARPSGRRCCAGTARPRARSSSSPGPAAPPMQPAR